MDICEILFQQQPTFCMRWTPILRPSWANNCQVLTARVNSKSYWGITSAPLCCSQWTWLLSLGLNQSVPVACCRQTQALGFLVLRLSERRLFYSLLQCKLHIPFYFPITNVSGGNMPEWQPRIWLHSDGTAPRSSLSLMIHSLAPIPLGNQKSEGVSKESPPVWNWGQNHFPLLLFWEKIAKRLMKN